jgi:hypothetical protein
MRRSQGIPTMGGRRRIAAILAQHEARGKKPQFNVALRGMQ